MALNQPKKEHIKFFIMTMVRNDMIASDIHNLLCTAWGENVISERQVRRLVQEMREGDRVVVSRKEGSGRKKTARSAENIEEIRRLLEDDPHLSRSALSHITGIPETSIQRIIVKDLRKHSVFARWIPHKLSDRMKDQRVIGARDILQQINGSVIVIDEKWLYKTPLPPRQNVRMWVDARGDRPEVPRRIISDEKYHIIAAMNYRGEFLCEVLPRGEAINSVRYIEFLTNLQRTRRQGNLVIMHDNARPHKSQMTENFLIDNGIGLVSQPPYSPDMNLLDRFIFRNMETERRNQEFDDINDARIFVNNYLATFRRHVLTNELAHFRRDLQAIINNRGEYLKP